MKREFVLVQNSAGQSGVLATPSTTIDPPQLSATKDEPIRAQSPVVPSPDAATGAPRWLIILAFAAVYIIWGSTYLAIRYVVETLPPFTTAGVRFGVAGCILLFLARLRDRTPLTPLHWRSAAISGCFMLLGGNGLVCWAEQYVSSGGAALLVATVPIWFAVFDWVIFGGSRPTLGMVAGLILGIIGIYVLIGPAAVHGEPIHFGGAIALLAACVFWSFGSLLSRRLTLPKSPFFTAGMQMICAGVAMTIVGFGIGERMNLQDVTPRAWWSLAYLIVFGSLLTLSAYVWLLTVTSPARVATYAYVNPVVALLLGAALGGEALTTRALLAVGLIVTAVVLITTYAKREPKIKPRTN